MPAFSGGAGSTANATCDIFHNNNTPPANNPDVTGVSFTLIPSDRTAHAAAIQTTTTGRWTHVALFDKSVDIRDSYVGGGPTGEGWDATKTERVYVPDKNGTPFIVIFVERVGRGTANDLKRAYLQRQAPTWPTSNI
jgi:hypothetical protein